MSHKNSREDRGKASKLEQKGTSLNQTLASINSMKALYKHHDKRQSADFGFELLEDSK